MPEYINMMGWSPVRRMRWENSQSNTHSGLKMRLFVLSSSPVTNFCPSNSATL